jgi:sn-glycerol 3-phosphate transport system substrate-binding protein
MKRSFLTTIISVVVVATLTLPGAADAQARTEISFWHGLGGVNGQAIDTLVTQFNQSQGEFEVKAVYKGTYPEVQAAAIAAYRQKNPPHIVQVSEVGTLSMLLSDAIVPVYRLMKQQEIAVNWVDFIETVTSYYSRDGKLFSMPFNTSTPILYYNKDIFRKAGLGDAPPATWQEVEAASRKILASGTATCGFTTPSPAWTLLENTFPWHDQPFATNQNGHTGLDTRLLINSDFGLMHVGALARWQKENIFYFGGPEGTRPNTKFADGECAMVLQSSGSIGNFKKSLPFDWGTGQLPHWGPPYPKARTSLGGATLWVLRGHKPEDYRGVAQFMEFLIGPVQQKWWAAITGYVPITKAAVKSLEDDSFYKQNPEQWTAVTQLLDAKVTAMSRGPRLGNYVQVREVIEFALENIFAGKRTVKQELDAATARGNAILRQFGVSHGAAGQGEI